MSPSKHTWRRFGRIVTATAIGVVLVAPAAAHAAEAPSAESVQPSPSLIAETARKYKKSPLEVANKARELAPIIRELAPKTPPKTERGGLSYSRVAKAPVDDCFQTLGGAHPAPVDGKCPEGFKPRINQGYPFGASRSGDYVYFGTAADILDGGQTMVGAYEPFANDHVVFEGRLGPAASRLGAAWGDHVAPQAWRINADTNKAENITPTKEQAPNLEDVVGLRGQGAHNDVVLLAGAKARPFGGVEGVDVLAYEGSTGKFLGEKLLPEYANIRHGEVIDGDLYFGVRLSGGFGGGGGAVLKWTGDKQDPFKFEVVAKNLPSEPGYIVGHNHRIITSGWTTTGAPGKAVGSGAEIYQSPVIPEGGLTAATADPASWKTIFKMSDYEPDPVISRASYFGAIASYKGKLIFSTYHIPGFMAMNAFNYYGKPASETERLNWVLKSMRATSVFTMDNPGEANQKVKLLYGSKQMYAYNTTSKKWELKDNNLHQTPAFGAAGFGNKFNWYSWQWVEYQGKLYMGTFDNTTFWRDVTEMFTGPNQLNLSPTTAALLKPVLNAGWAVSGGGDVYTMTDPDRPVVPFNLDGFNNKLAQGVRGFVPFDDKGKLFAGNATFANLATTGNNTGGWEFNVIK